MIELENLSVNLRTFRLESLSLRIAPGEFFMIVGPSGAGKTILLESIAGLRSLAGGRVRIRGLDVTPLPPERRNVALVYQEYALFPHMNVERNIRWGLRFAALPDDAHVHRLIDLLKLKPLLGRSPETLSGGEQQRVALARALAVKPSVLLLDEPLSALDPSFREDLRDYLAEINRGGMTLVMVSHDFGEVLSLGNRVAVISDGVLQQVGDVRSVFRAPANRSVAEFVGMKNLFPASIRGTDAVTEGGATLLLGKAAASGERLLGIRPEDVVIGAEHPGDSRNAFQGKVVSIVPRGMAFEVIMRTDGGMRITARVLSSALLSGGVAVGGEYWASFSPDSVHVL